jgi:hypothetical protein
MPGNISAPNYLEDALRRADSDDGDGSNACLEKNRRLMIASDTVSILEARVAGFTKDLGEMQGALQVLSALISTTDHNEVLDLLLPFQLAYQ